jgi:NhaA family Na+:H+ antiporter
LVLCVACSKKAALPQLPEQVTMRKLFAAGCTAGIGFTMSIFIATLAFPGPEVLNISKMAILIGSLVAALSGILILRTGKA